MGQTAKIFMNGRSQAVFIRRDPSTGDLILSRKPDSWDDFFLALKDTEIPKDFLSPKDRKQGNQIRDPLDGVNE